MFEENLENAEKHQVKNKNYLLFHPEGPFCNDFLAQSRTALPHPPEEKPIVLPGGAGCAGDGCNLHFLHPFWSLVPCLERKGLN